MQNTCYILDYPLFQHLGSKRHLANEEVGARPEGATPSLLPVASSSQELKKEERKFRPYPGVPRFKQSFSQGPDSEGKWKKNPDSLDLGFHNSFVKSGEWTFIHLAFLRSSLHRLAADPVPRVLFLALKKKNASLKLFVFEERKERAQLIHFTFSFLNVTSYQMSLAKLLLNPISKIVCKPIMFRKKYILLPTRTFYPLKIVWRKVKCEEESNFLSRSFVPSSSHFTFLHYFHFFPRIFFG